MNRSCKKYGIDSRGEDVEVHVQEYFDRLAYYVQEEPFMQRQWAKF